jgi:NTP pyrophosphatase (non-canonical NTP hydrolase)
MNYKELEIRVKEWAVNKGLIVKSNQQQQMLKCVSEVGELADALIKKDTNGIKDGLGDVLVTLIILSKQLDYDLTECLEIAYNEIKDRQGITINGTFIKE